MRISFRVTQLNMKNSENTKYFATYASQSQGLQQERIEWIGESFFSLCLIYTNCPNKAVHYNETDFLTLHLNKRKRLIIASVKSAVKLCAQILWHAANL